jgi:hypothetical protein
VKRQTRETADGGQPSHFGTSIKSTRLPSLPFVRLLSLSQVAKWTVAHLQRATAQQFGCHRPPLALVLADKTKEGSLVSNCPSNVAWWALLFLLMMTRLTACSAPPSRAPYEGSGRTPTVPAGAEATPPRRWPNARGSQISQGQALCLPRSKLFFFFLSSFLRRKRKGDVVPEGPPTPMVRASLKPAHQKTHFETLYQRPCDTWCGWEPIFLLPGPVTHQSPWGKTALAARLTSTQVRREREEPGFSEKAVRQIGLGWADISKGVVVVRVLPPAPPILGLARRRAISLRRNPRSSLARRRHDAAAAWAELASSALSW